MKRYAIIAAAAVLGGTLAGCSGGSDPSTSKTPVAKVNGEDITLGDFYNRVLGVSAPDLAPALPMNGQAARGVGKAGEFAMQSMVGERMIMQFAKQKNAVPADAEVNAYVTFAKKYRNPQYTFMPDDPYRNDDDWRRQAKDALCFRKMALAQSPVKETDLKSKYEAVKNQLKEQDQFHLRLIDIKDKAKAEKALGKLAKGVPFETVALTDSEDTASGPRNGDIGFVPDAMLQQRMPNLAVEVKKLKVGEYTKQLVIERLPARGTAPGTPGAGTEARYFIVQLVESKPGRVPTYEEVKPIIEIACITEKDPGAFQRVQTQLSDFREKAKIEIFIKSYEHMFDKTKTSTPGTPPSGGKKP